MGYKDIDGLSSGTGSENSPTILQADGQSLDLPDASFVRDADIIRDGMDLVLDGPDGTIIVEDYFNADTPPNLTAPGGLTLTPDLVESFAKAPPEYAQNLSMSDVTPVGEVNEVSGEAMVVRADGSSESITLGTEIYQGDVIETDADGAVNIVFVDETSFAVSEEARLAIDEYVFDPATQSGSTDFSVLKGVFVFTSGLIGRDDPDDVEIDTPIGSIGIRGTIIAGNVDTGEITVVEGAIVLRDNNGNEMTLANQFETGKFDPVKGTIENMGELSANDVGQKFSSVADVSPGLFSSLQDAALEDVQPSDNQARDADGSADDNGDGQVDGTAAQDDEPVPEGEPVDEQTDAMQDDTLDSGDALPPPPTSTTTNTGFDSTTSSGLSTTSTSNTTTTTTAIAGTTSEDTGEPPPPPPPSSDPADPNAPPPPPPPTGTNTAPQLNENAPDEFFASANQQLWGYHFDKEFEDFDSGGAGQLNFQLSQATVDTLNDLRDPGGLDVLSWWSFDANTGFLQMDFQPSFTGITPGLFHNFDIDVRAIDGGGLTSNFASFDFDVWALDNSLTPNLDGGVNDGWVISDSSWAAPVNLGPGTAVTGVKLFLGGVSNTVNIQNGSNGNDIYLGDGDNSVNVSGGYNNQIVGGFGKDTFSLSEASNHMYGMDGDDDFKLDLFGNTVTTELEVNAVAGDAFMDGGWSDFRAAIALQDLGLAHNVHPGSANGRGDSLVLHNSGSTESLDFRNIDNEFFAGIERLELGVGNQIVDLDYNDIMQMTDNHNTLIIRLEDAGDSIDLHNMAGMVKVADDVVIDDARQGETPDPQQFDIFTDGNVTLLIGDSGNGGSVQFDSGGAITI